MAGEQTQTGMGKAMQIVFMVLAGVITLYLVITIATTLLSEGQSMTEILSLSNWLPGGSTS